MRRALGLMVTVVAASTLAQACAGGVAQTASVESYGVYGVDRYFTLEWQPDERRGKPMVSGYVTNTWGTGVNNVRMRVEALDAAGGVSGTYIGYVFGDVTPGTRAYFEVPVPQKAASYRVSVLSFDPVQCRG